MTSETDKLRAEVEVLKTAEKKIRKERQEKEGKLRTLYAKNFLPVVSTLI